MKRASLCFWISACLCILPCAAVANDLAATAPVETDTEQLDNAIATLQQAAQELDQAQQQGNLEIAQHDTLVTAWAKQMEDKRLQWQAAQNDLATQKQRVYELQQQLIQAQHTLRQTQAPLQQWRKAVHAKDANDVATQHNLANKRTSTIEQLDDVQLSSGIVFDAVSGKPLNGTLFHLGPVATLFLTQDRTRAGSVHDGVLNDLGALERESLTTWIKGNSALLWVASEPCDIPQIPSPPPPPAPPAPPPPPPSMAQELQAGGWIMIPLLTLGIIALCIAAWKAFELYRLPLSADVDMLQLEKLLNSGDTEAAQLHVNHSHGPVRPVMERILQNHDAPLDRQEEILHEELIGALPMFDRGMPLIAIGAAAAPLLGLLGTVTGIIATFRELGLEQGQSDAFAAGISEALITTKYGLITAVICLLCHALLSRRIRSLTAALEKSTLAYLNARASSINDG